MGGTRWIYPGDAEGFIQLTALWQGMVAPVVLLVNGYRLDPDGQLEVISGDGCPYVALLPSTALVLLTAEKVPG